MTQVLNTLTDLGIFQQYLPDQQIWKKSLQINTLVIVDLKWDVEKATIATDEELYYLYLEKTNKNLVNIKKTIKELFGKITIDSGKLIGNLEDIDTNLYFGKRDIDNAYRNAVYIVLNKEPDDDTIKVEFELLHIIFSIFLAIYDEKYNSFNFNKIIKILTSAINEEDRIDLITKFLDINPLNRKEKFDTYIEKCIKPNNDKFASNLSHHIGNGYKKYDKIFFWKDPAFLKQCQNAITSSCAKTYYDARMTIYFVKSKKPKNEELGEIAVRIISYLIGVSNQIFQQYKSNINSKINDFKKKKSTLESKITRNGDDTKNLKILDLIVPRMEETRSIQKWTQISIVVQTGGYNHFAKYIKNTKGRIELIKMLRSNYKDNPYEVKNIIEILIKKPF